MFSKMSWATQFLHVSPPLPRKTSIGRGLHKNMPIKKKN